MKKILIVEDNEMNLDLARQILDGDYEIVEATDGLKAIEVAIAEQPDLILMDLSLPEIDGWEATRRLKKDERTATIPVIAVTAHAIRGEYEKAMEAGCDSYLTKPIEASLLLQEVAEWLAKAESGE